jgi:hypothetical protein
MVLYLLTLSTLSLMLSSSTTRRVSTTTDRTSTTYKLSSQTSTLPLSAPLYSYRPVRTNNITSNRSLNNSERAFQDIHDQMMQIVRKSTREAINEAGDIPT